MQGFMNKATTLYYFDYVDLFGKLLSSLFYPSHHMSFPTASSSATAFHRYKVDEELKQVEKSWRLNFYFYLAIILVILYLV